MRIGGGTRRRYQGVLLRWCWCDLSETLLSVRKASWRKFGVRVLTFAARSDITIAISLPSSSFLGFLVTTVALVIQLLEKGRIDLMSVGACTCVVAFRGMVRTTDRERQTCIKVEASCVWRGLAALKILREIEEDILNDSEEWENNSCEYIEDEWCTVEINQLSRSICQWRIFGDLTFGQLLTPPFVGYWYNRIRQQTP